MKEKAKVSIQRCFHYEAAELKTAIQACLQPLGGLETFVSPGDRVLLKPNFVSAKPVAQACNTHPEFIFAVCDLVRALGATPVIGESPALGSSMAAAKKMGMAARLKAEKIGIIDFTESTKVRSEKGHCHLRIAKEIEGYDKIINLPKLKSHGQMRMTCCVKNLFGFVVGRHKAGLHMSIGHHEDWFSAMILDVAERVKPTLHLVDAVIALEKGGPIYGSPLELGIIAAGVEALAVDTAIYDLLGVDPLKIPVQVEARRQELHGSRIEDVDVWCDAVALRELPNFEPREQLVPISFSPWHIVRGYIKQCKRRLLKQ